MTEHLATERALFVLALETDDPERREALAHAEQCAPCRELLAETRELMRLLDTEVAQAAVVAKIDPAFEARVHAAVYANAAAQAPKVWANWARIGVGIGALVSLLLAWVDLKQSPAFDMRIGMHCFFYEQAFAVGAFALGLASAKRYRVQSVLQGAWPSAFCAMTGAVAGQGVLLWRCHAHGAGVHLLLFHVLGVAVATALAAAAGPRFTRAFS
ncbi:MAG: hypothetical protein RL701_5057 [Pseudomonadota bacterium]